MNRPTALLLVGLLAGCPPHDHEDHEGEHHDGHDDEESHGIIELTPEAFGRIDIRVADVEQIALSHVLSTTGRVDFDQDHFAHVAPRVPGRVHRVDATLGAKVKQGQTLAVIDSLELGQTKSAFLRAKAQLELATKTRQREETLLEDRITSQQTVLEAKANEQRALAEHQAAKQSLKLLGLSDKQIARVGYDDPAAAHFPIRSPIAGTVVEKHVNLGEVVSPERNLFSIADLSRVWIWVDVYERDLGRVHLEDHVAVTVAAFPERTFEGEVAYIRSQVDPKTRTAQARIDVKNEDGALRPGMFAKVTVEDPHRDEKKAPLSLVVPASAVQRDGDRSVVFVPIGKRRFEQREVTVGQKTATSVEILNGLEKSERVVTKGTFYLKSEAAKESMGGGHSH